VASELTREDEADSSLDLTGRESSLLVVADKAAGLSSDLLEDVVDERVHDGHGALGDTGLRVDLLQDLEDVGRVRLSALLTLAALLLLSRGLGRSLGCNRCLASSGHFV